MKRTRVILLALAVVGAMLTMAAPSGAVASQPTPRWMLHIQRFPGGISNGVRAMASPAAAAAQARHLRASGAASTQALSSASTSADGRRRARQPRWTVAGDPVPWPTGTGPRP